LEQQRLEVRVLRCCFVGIEAFRDRLALRRRADVERDAAHEFLTMAPMRPLPSG